MGTRCLAGGYRISMFRQNQLQPGIGLERLTAHPDKLLRSAIIKSLSGVNGSCFSESSPET